MFEEVRQHLKEILDAGTIRESQSPSSSNIVLVRKKDNSLRFCINFRKLNAEQLPMSIHFPEYKRPLTRSLARNISPNLISGMAIGRLESKTPINTRPPSLFVH